MIAPLVPVPPPAPLDPVLSEIAERTRTYRDHQQARGNLVRQAQARCRRLCGGDPAAGRALYDQAWKLWKAEGEPDADAPALLRVVWPTLLPFFAGIQAQAEAEHAQELVLAWMARKSLVGPWGKAQCGLGEKSLAQIIGEATTAQGSIGSYRSGACLWKRFGLAVIEGARQGKRQGEAALAQGYCPRRRSLMFVVAECLMKSGKAKASPWYRYYEDMKALELAKATERQEPMTPAHAHNRALRKLAKELLKRLWLAWREAEQAQAAGAAEAAP